MVTGLFSDEDTHSLVGYLGSPQFGVDLDTRIRAERVDRNAEAMAIAAAAGTTLLAAVCCPESKRHLFIVYLLPRVASFACSILLASACRGHTAEAGRWQLQLKSCRRIKRIGLV